MNAEMIYKAALQEMAAEGNVAASMTLKLGAAASSKVELTSTLNAALLRAIAAHINLADRALGDALGHNDMKWTRATDRCIENARNALNEAKMLMIK